LEHNSHCVTIGRNTSHYKYVCYKCNPAHSNVRLNNMGTLSTSAYPQDKVTRMSRTELCEHDLCFYT
jgi:hypothetical protein